jgi:hypothetical protein
MTRRANGSLRDRTEDVSGPSLDAGWDEVPESSAIPTTAASHTLPPIRTVSESRTVGATTIPTALRSIPPSVLPPVTIAPRPRSSSRVPAPVSLHPFSMQGRSARGELGPTASGHAASDDPTLEVSFQFLDEALFDLVDGSGPSEDPDSEASEPGRIPKV